MKLIAVVAVCFAMAGCMATPVARNFPDIPPSLQQSCPELQLVPPGTTQFSKTLEIVAENYALYNQCRILVETWQGWYQQQREIFESVQ